MVGKKIERFEYFLSAALADNRSAIASQQHERFLRHHFIQLFIRPAVEHDAAVAFSRIVDERVHLFCGKSSEDA